ncbi:MAG: secondary thiamine-phosphate synthase enzyme YjbQ [Pseudomonadota bacterium]
MSLQKKLVIETRGRGTYPITEPVAAVVRDADMETGLCHVFLHHTSASLILCENADARVRTDLEDFMARLVKDGDPRFSHADEGADDMAAHIRSILTSAEVTLPVTGGRLALGTWQDLYLWEHRYQAHRRQLTVTVQG